MAQTVLEMELEERDLEIEQLRRQIKQQDQERTRIIDELGLNRETLRASDPNISSLTPVQVNDLLSLLAHERALNNDKKKKPRLSASQRSSEHL